MVDQASEQTASTPRAGLIRLGVGLAQGIAILILDAVFRGKHGWAAAHPILYGAMFFTVLFVPVIPLTALGSMRRMTLIVWTAMAAAVIAAMAGYGFWRQTDVKDTLEPSVQLILAIAVGLFIAHRLVAAADADRRPIAAYATYFDVSWKHGVQLVLSWAFVGAFWAALGIGVALFSLIGIKAFGQIVSKEWFYIPVTTVVFAGAVHVADVRASLTKGIRTVGLTLLSWLMPVLGLIAVMFLVALPFTGLHALWQLQRSTAVLLGAAAALIVLINAAYQDGEADTRAPVFLRVAARITALTPLPLLVIAAMGLFMRTEQHGLTPDRIVAAACLIVGFCYAIGYAIAAALPGPWMKPLEITNVFTAFVVLVVILALFSPIADPARISVADQVKRLETGKTKPEKFDLKFLRFDSGRFGQDALKKLAAAKSGPAGAVAKKAAEVMAMKARYEMIDTPAAAQTTMKVYPAGAKLPDGFEGQAWAGSPPCFNGADVCDAFVLDVDGDGKPEVLVNTGTGMSVFHQDAKGGWSRMGSLPSYCNGVTEALRAGDYKVVPPVWRELEIKGHRYRIESQNSCTEGPGPEMPKGPRD